MRARETRLTYLILRKLTPSGNQTLEFLHNFLFLLKSLKDGYRKEGDGGMLQ